MSDAKSRDDCSAAKRRRVHLFDAEQTCSFCGQPWSKHDPTLPDDPDGPMLLCPVDEQLAARGVGNGPVAGRFVLLESHPDAQFYVTSWDTWEEAEAAFPIPFMCFLRDDETGREWLPGARYEWEAART